MDPQQQQQQSGSGLAPSGQDASATPEPDPKPGHSDRRPHWSDGFIRIPPNQSQRSKILMMARKEEEELQKWREANRPLAVHLQPERLGGDGTMAAARQRQHVDLHCSKLQKKLKQEELDKRRRQEEAEELQKMKAKQREKAERLQERQQQEEQRRRAQFQQDHLRMNDTFLQRFERITLDTVTSSSVTATSSKKEEGAGRVRDVQKDHKRVNSAFLDRLENRKRAMDKETEGAGVSAASEELGQLASSSPRPQLPLTHLEPGRGGPLEAELDPDDAWALMKLTSIFPACSRDFLMDILKQCSGDFEKACTLLVCTHS